MNRSELRVVVADDDDAVREALADLIRSQRDLELVGTADNHEDLVNLVRHVRPDVVVMDVRMPRGVAWTSIGQIKASVPHVSVVAVSAFDEPDDIFMTSAAGASAYLLKGSADLELLEAVHRATRGQFSIPLALHVHVLRNVLRDIEQLRRMEAALQRSEGAFKDLLDSAPTGVVLVGPGDRIRLANAEADRMFGRFLNKLIGQSASQLLPAWARPAFLAMLDQAHQEHVKLPSGVSNQLAGLRQDGTEFPAVIEMRSLRLGEEYVVGVFVRDLTGARTVETRYQRLIESSPDALVILDADRRIELVNARAEQLFGYERGDLLATPVELVLPGGMIESYLHGSAQESAGSALPAVGQSISVVGRRRDGSEFPAELSVNALDDEQGSFVVAVHDVTEQRRHEEVLEESFEFLRDIDRGHHLLLTHLVRAQEDERKRISVGIHDDSLQAITAASLRVQQLRRRLDDPRDLEVLAKLEETIQLSISRLRHLIFDLRPPASEKGGLAAALRTYLEQLRRDAPIDFQVESTMNAELPADTQVIAYRIAQEALTNVSKHAQATSVRVTISGLDEGCLVLIEDDGKGYDPIVAERKPRHLGLSLMQERAQIAGGWCRIESTPGRGTTVQFWIPEDVDAAEIDDFPTPVGRDTP
jgi:PAS domain S-box-containing protein